MNKNTLNFICKYNKVKLSDNKGVIRVKSLFKEKDKVFIHGDKDREGIIEDKKQIKDEWIYIVREINSDKCNIFKEDLLHLEPSDNPYYI